MQQIQNQQLASIVRQTINNNFTLVDQHIDSVAQQLGSFNTRLGAVENAIMQLQARHTNVPAWATNTAYAVGDLVRYAQGPYICIIAHTSTGGFNAANWHAFAMS